MYFSKDTDSVHIFESPWIQGGWTPGQRLGVISLQTPQQKWASSSLKGRTSWIFSSCGRCSRLRTGPQGPALLVSGKDNPKASCSGASRDSSPGDAGA